MRSPRSLTHLAAVLVSLIFSSAVTVSFAANPGYYRFPAIHGNTIIFTAEGDLWTVGVDGGVARRLDGGVRERRTPH